MIQGNYFRRTVEIFNPTDSELGEVDRTSENNREVIRQAKNIYHQYSRKRELQETHNVFLAKPSLQSKSSHQSELRVCHPSVSGKTN